jgi:two-component system, OmpR family, response regulator TctD
MRLLLVEDNQALAEGLRQTLSHERHTIDWVDNGADADYLLSTQRFDLVILDLGLPRLSGEEVLRRLRARRSTTPVLVLTAASSLHSRVHQLDSGADDVVAKPFEVEELEARIRVLLRRSSQQAHPLMQCAGLGFDSKTGEAQLNGQVLTLTPRERAVLELLMNKLGSTVSKQALSQSLSSIDEAVSADAVEIYVHRLRKKIDQSGATIVTLRGLGYLLRPVHDGP